MRLPLLPAVLLFVLFSAGSPHAQTIPPVGTPDAFDVATWNIEHFGSPTAGPANVELQFRNVLAVIRQAEIDLWALQELNHQPTFLALLDSLGSGWDGVWQRDETVSGFTGYGYVWRTDRATVVQVTTILRDHNFDFAFRPPLLIRANLSHEGGARSGIRIVNIHAKCCGSLTDWERRWRASDALKIYTDNFVSANLPILIMGDLNDRFRISNSQGRPSPYRNFLMDEEGYHVGSLSLEDAGTPTYCSNNTCTSGSTIDHIVVSRPLIENYVENSTQRYDALISHIPNYRSTTSDHVAVHASFSFATDVSSEPLPEDDALVLTAYPNPMRSSGNVEFTLEQASAVRLSVYDVLGREMQVLVQNTLSAGTYAAEVDASALPTGVYFLRLQADNRSLTRRISVVR
ncbi:hypothetical protein BH23BAC4_BH23BAC4_16110 [soil metagenome]